MERTLDPKSESNPIHSRSATEGTMATSNNLDLEAPDGFSLSDDENIDWSGWLDFDADNISSPPHLSPGSGSGASMASPLSIVSNNTTVKQEIWSLSPQETSSVKIASEYTHSISSPVTVKLSKSESPTRLQAGLHQTQSYLAKDSDSIHTNGTNSVMSLGSLKKRLHYKYTGSLLYDIKSLMDRLTISEVSNTSSTMKKSGANYQRTTVAVSEPAITLPGFFPQYCWEHLFVDQLMRCDDLPSPCTQGQIYTPQSPETHRAMRSEVMFRIRSNSIRKDDLDDCTDAFGNSVLHVAATLGASPSYLSSLINMGADIHCLNIAGQSFLHLIHLSQPIYITEFRFLIGNLKRLGFDFKNQDDNGQTIFHILLHSCVPSETIDDALQCFRYHGISLPGIRDNTGLDVSRRLPVFEMLSPAATNDEIHRTYSMATNTMSVLDEYPSLSYVQIARRPSAPIENLADLQNYELHADLLRSILRATESLLYEDTNGRNGLHCLASVRLDLPVSTANLNDGSSALKSPQLETTLRERYLEQLIQSGVDPNSYDFDGITPFMAFVANVRDEEDDNLTSKILGRLCRSGANINLRNREGETSLHLAVKLGRRAATKFLLARGANVHARTKDGTGILSLGHKHSDRASKDDVLYAQISLCMSLVASAGAVSAPSIFREWASEDFRIAPDRPTPILSPRGRDSTSPTTMKAKAGKGYYGRPAYGPWPATQGTSWVVSAK